MKTLVVIAHPEMKESKINYRWVQELEKYPEEFTVHKLYEVYPGERIDVKNEQKLIEEHENLVLQFPIYWFNSPPLMKKWLDEVFTYGWAYGSKGKKLVNKKIALAVSAGISYEGYSKEGKYQYTLEEVLLPFKMTFDYINASYKGFEAFYGAENKLIDNRVEESVGHYINFLKNI